MSRSLRVAALGAVAAAGWLAGPGGPAASAAAPSTPDVTTRPARIEAVLGDTVTVGSTVTNGGSAPTGRLIAHLDVVSLDNEVYVDPEDWSAERSVDLGSLPPGASRDLSWPVRTVNAGEFAVYVVLVPAGEPGAGDPGVGRSPGAAGARVAASRPVQLSVAGRRTLDAGGALPVVLGVPAVLALAGLAVRLRRRRARTAGAGTPPEAHGRLPV